VARATAIGTPVLDLMLAVGSPMLDAPTLEVA
jgi:hypothetical protein